MEQNNFMPFIRVRNMNNLDRGNYKGFDLDKYKKFVRFEIQSNKLGEISWT